MASKARKLLTEIYTKPKLQKIFAERISRTRAVGRDGIRISSFEGNVDHETALIVSKVFARSYKFTRYKEKLISKGAGKNPRVISIPTVRDRVTLRALCDFLSEMFRDAAIKKPHSYIKEIKRKAATASADSVFIRLDIKDYYGSIDRELLMRKIKRKLRTPEALHLIKTAIGTPTTSSNPDKYGIPQGLSISNILASIYLADCDTQMQKRWAYFRYVDDILIVCKESETKEVLDQLSGILKKHKLLTHEINKEGSKSYIAPLAEGAEYLGFKVTSSKTSIRDQSFKKMFATLGSVLTDFRYNRLEGRLIWRLNLKISGCKYENRNLGWVFFFLQSDDLSQLARLDHFVFLQLKKRGVGHLRKRIKRFVRAYHEIRYRSAESQYVPDFDNFSYDDMRAAIREITGQNEADLQNKNDHEVEFEFFSLINKEVSELEKDLMESTS